MLQFNDSSQTRHGENTASRSLQPMGFTDILDSMFSLYRKHFRLFVSICGVYFMIGLAADLLDGILAVLISSADHLSIISRIDRPVSRVTSILAASALLVATGSLFFGVTQVYLGNSVTFTAVIKEFNRRIWSFIFCNLLYGIVIITLISIGALGPGILFLFEIYLPETAGWIIGAICVLVALYIGVRWIFCSLAAVFEEKSAIRALKRSGELVKGGWWRVFGMLFAIFLLTFFILSILPFSWGLISGITDNMQVDEEPLQEDMDLVEGLASMFVAELPELTSWIGFAIYAVWSCLGLAINCLILPVGIIGVTLVYFDQRIRKEAFDIEMRVTNEPV